MISGINCGSTLILVLSAAAAMRPGPACADYPSEMLSENPLAFYRFDDGLAAPSGDSAVNLGTLGAAGKGAYTANIVHSAAGALGDTANKSAGFTNNGFSVPWNAGLNNQGSFTVELWMQPATVQAAAALVCPVASMHVADPRAGWLIYQGDDATGWNFRTYNQNGTATAASISSGTPLTAGTWYHVVAVWDDATGTARLYVNGALVATSDAGLTYVANADGPFALGSRSDNAFGWQGKIDEPAYYAKALGADRILAHYTAGLSTAVAPAYQNQILADGPVGYWRLDEPAFTPAVAANAGSLGAAAAGGYYGEAKNTPTGPSSGAGFLGFAASNSALSLNGTNAYVGTPLSLLNDKSEFTVSGWVKRGAVHSERGGYFGQNDLLEFGDASAGTTIEAYVEGIGSLTNGYIADDDNWLNIVLTGNATETVLYLDGEPVVTNTAARPDGFGTSTYFFNMGGGGVFNVSGDFFRGDIDEVAVLDKALSASRVKVLYDAALGNVPPVLVSDPPLVSPEDGIIRVGSTFSLNSEATGTPPLAFQWRRNGTAIPGANSATYTVTSATTADSGVYSLAVSNPIGSTVSARPFTVNVDPAVPPSIETPPMARSTYAGGSYFFSVTAGGTQPFTYQWLLNGTGIPGATSGTYSVAATAAAQGNYSVRVTNAAGSITSAAAAATLVTPTPGSYDELVMSHHPLAYWKFEDSGDTTIDSAGGNDGIYVSGAEPFTSEAPLPAGGFPGFSATNHSVEFDGSSGYIKGPAGLLNGLTEYTLSGWVRRTELAGRVSAFFGQNDRVEFGNSNDARIGGWSNGGVGGLNPLEQDEWGFVSFTSSATAGRKYIYVNGNLIGSSAYTSAPDNTEPFCIGGGSWNPAGTFTDNFAGQIDEVAIFNKALSAGEILGLYSRATGITAGGPVVSVLPGGAGAVALAAETFDSSEGGYTVETPDPSDQTDWKYEAGTWRSNGQADGYGSDNTSFLTSPSHTVTQAGMVSLTFSHRYSYEQGNWDGGAVAVSFNGGPFVRVAPTAFSVGGYNGMLRSDTDSRLGGLPGFVLNSAGHPAFLSSTCLLGSAAVGDKVRVQFISSSDNNTSGDLTPQGWQITSLSLSQGGPSAAYVAWPAGVLQMSFDLTTPWLDVPGNDPMVLDTTQSPRLFFRIKP